MQLEQRLEEALRALGTEDIGHSRRTFFAHLTGTYTLLKNWGNPEEVCAGGLFHSIYGTEFFRTQVVQVAEREKIVALIGARAERLAYYFCAAGRRHLLSPENQAPPHKLRDRFVEKEYEITPADFKDLCEIAIANFLEQAPSRDSLPQEKLLAYQGRYSACLVQCSPGANAAFRAFFGR